jgi:hypothetical protein
MAQRPAGADDPANGHLPSLLFARGAAADVPQQQEEDYASFARDLNLDQIVKSVAADHEERDLITAVCPGTCATRTPSATGRRSSRT